MGFFDSLLGNDAADASNAAAADTYRKQQAATAALRGAGSQYATDVGGLASNYDPYRQAGRSALTQLMGGLGLGGPGGSEAFTSAYRSLPGYTSGLERGTDAAIKAANATGRGASGATLKALQRYGSDYEDQRVGDYLTRLMGLQGQGLQATGAATGVQQQALGGNLQAQLAAGQGDFQSSGTVGEGMVAGEQAKQSALQNLLGTAAYLGGSALGGGFGGSLGGGLGSAFKFGGGTSLMSNKPRVGPFG